MNKKKFLVLIFVSLSLSACVTSPLLKEQKAETKVSVLTFNVENLFDVEDDPDKNDETFLPLSMKDERVQNRCRVQNFGHRISECLEKDWSPSILDRKMRRLTDVLSSVNSGKGPDILILQEVENEKVLRQWRDGYLQSMRYDTLILIEGPDDRGIDTAILSRLAQVEPAKLHRIDFTLDPNIKPEEIRETRGILEARLKLPNGDPLAVFAVHLPSQGAPTIFRKVALQNLLAATAKLPPGVPMIVGGDFNITSREDWERHYFGNLVAKDFAVSHVVGCRGCRGTTYYPGDQTWSFFDVLLFSKSLTANKSAWRVDPESIHVANDSIYQTNRFGTPARFGTGLGTVGVSDHWPMYAELELLSASTAGVKE